MEKANMHSLDMVNENIKKIGNLFPECVTETVDENGNIKAAIDFEKLQENLSHATIGEGEERYQFTWPGKREAIHNANAPTNMTLRPCKEESVDFDKTENLYIEGDNLEVLKLLQENYLGKVKMIYIDPPYNTGNDFVYNDDFKENSESFQSKSGMYDEDGNMLLQNFEKNTESNGRFHTDWLNMMYPRLKIARNLLSDDGIIYVSIDDHEVENLRKICDEIFGISNFIAQIIVDGTPKNDPYVVSTAHEYCLVFCKNYEHIKVADYGVASPHFRNLMKIFEDGQGNYETIAQKICEYYKENDLEDDNISNYKYVDNQGIFRIGPIDDPQGGGARDERINPITGNPCVVPKGGWRCNLETWNEWVANGLVNFPDNDKQLPSKKTYISSDRLDVMHAYFKMQTRRDTVNLKNLFGLSITPFSNPKPIELIRTFVENCNDKNMLVLDFFSGSGTTQNAVMLQNLKDSGLRKCISVQIDEKIDVTSGQSNKQKKISQAAIEFLTECGKKCVIPEIAKERIRRAGKKIKEEFGEKAKDLDIGFRVLKLADSNMKDVYYSPAETDSADIFDANNVKEDRTPLDLLFQVMPECNLPLSSKIEERKIEGKTVYFVNGNYLVACFDEGITEKLIKSVIDVPDSEKPYYFYMRNLGLESDKVLDNFEQLFVHYSPTTKRKVI
jgi:adenine-specific DNA-methyltransferase